MGGASSAKTKRRGGGASRSLVRSVILHLRWRVHRRRDRHLERGRRASYDGPTDGNRRTGLPGRRKWKRCRCHHCSAGPSWGTGPGRAGPRGTTTSPVALVVADRRPGSHVVAGGEIGGTRPV